MTPNQRLTLWIGAFRYYLGRQTYAVSDFVELLIAEWGNLDHPIKLLISKELQAAIAADDKARAEQSRYKPLGSDCDRRQWERLLPLLPESD